MSNESTETVYLAKRCHGGHKQTYHTDTDCRNLNQATHARPVPRGHRLLEDRRECKHCSDDYTPHSGGSRDMNVALHHLQPEELGLTKRGERA